MWFPQMGKMTKDFVSSCRECAAAVPGNPPAPIETQLMPEKAWEVVAADFKGPIGGVGGYYFHVMIGMYSYTPRW